MWAPLVQLVYQESDLPGFLTTNQPKSTNLPNSSLVPPNAHHTSAGTLVGIVIGALILVVFIFALVWFLLLQRQRQTKRGNPDGGSASVTEWLKAELPGQAKQMFEAGGQDIGRKLPTGTTCLLQELEVPEVERELQAETTILAQELEAPNMAYELHNDPALQMPPAELEQDPWDSRSGRIVEHNAKSVRDPAGRELKETKATRLRRLGQI
ncbi:MAG: hypothetical protein Q9165_006006 [Trypethelium subeluteriae]